MIQLELDHLGIIVKSIEKEIEVYRKLGYICDSEIFQDDILKMRGIFVKPLCDKGYKIELIEDRSESKALYKIMNSQCGKIYHLAFRIKALEEQLDQILNQLDAKILLPITESTYYKKVCFIFLPNAQIIELVEYK